MKFKKIIAAVVVLALSATLASCSCNSNEGPSIKIATGTIKGSFNALYATEDGDKVVASLIMPSMYSHDRSGLLLSDAANGKKIVFNGIDYEYSSFANFKSEYDEAQNISTYTITVSDNNKFSDGNDITVDDLIFTYYVLCDKSYDGTYELNQSKILGLLAYQYDNNQAPFIEVTDEIINETVSNPPEDLKKQVSEQIIKPVLLEARAFCEENWQKYVDRNFGNSAQELFVNLFPTAIDSGYKAGEKSFDEVFNDTVELYGMNYKAIARNFYGDVEYLNEKAEKIIYEYVFTDLLKSAGGQPVSSISGIQKIDNRSIQIQTYGTIEETEKLICDIPLLSVKTFGNTSFNYDSNEFGIKRGETADIRTMDKTPIGYGQYVIGNFDKETGEVYLTPNDNYKGAKANAAIKLIHVEEENKVTALKDKKVDLAVLDMNADEVSELEGDNGLKISSFNGNEYEYVGFNTTKLIAGESAAETEDGESIENPNFHLRTALGIIISSLRVSAIENTNKSIAKITNYPGSPSSWATPMITDSDYKVAYSFTTDGEMIKEGKSIEAAIKEFKLAGYRFDDNNKLISTDGMKETFNVAIPKYELDNPTMMELFEEFEKAVTDLGFKIEPSYFEETDEFIVTLAAKSEDIWFAKRDTANLNIEKFYKTDAEMNYYGYTNETVDALIESSKDNQAAQMKNYPEVYKQVMEDAIEVPVYHKQVAVVYNPNVAYFDETVNITEFYGFFSALNGLYFADKVPANVKAATTVADTTTTAPSSTQTTTTSTESKTTVDNGDEKQDEAPVEEEHLENNE